MAADIRAGLKRVIGASVTVPRLVVVDNLPDPGQEAFGHPWVLLGDMDVEVLQNSWRPRDPGVWEFEWELAVGIGSGVSTGADGSFDRVYQIWEQMLRGIALDTTLGVPAVVTSIPFSTVMGGVYGVRGVRETSLLLTLIVTTKGLGG